jgi:hypothetical protein
MDDIRDDFANHAMAAIIAKTPLSINEDAMVAVTVLTARGAYNYADAMMARRSGEDATNGWVYNGPDGEWHWSEHPDNHESVTNQRPATPLEMWLMREKKENNHAR